MNAKMKNAASDQARRAFSWARGKAFLSGIRAVLQGRSNDLLVYDEVRKKVKASQPIYKGTQSVPLSQIIGSVDRYHDFDRAFMPSQNHTRSRWQRVGEAYYEHIALPPITLYKVGDVYFVVDGNHRVSVARQLGQAYIDAVVQECRVRVPVTPDLDPQNLEIIGEKVEFLERTHFDELYPEISLDFSFPGGYFRILEHIEAHRYMQSQEWKREFSFEEAMKQWVEQVYLLVAQVIRESDILRDFPGRSEADLYLWVIEHQYFLRERFGDRVGIYEAAHDFADHFSTRPFKRVWHYLTHHLLPERTSTDDLAS